MSPKGIKKAPKDMGSVCLHNDSWEAKVTIDGETVRGPPRTYRQDADADLSEAKQKATQEQMRTFLIDLRGQVQAAEGSASFRQGTAQPLAGIGPERESQEVSAECIPQSLTGLSSSLSCAARTLPEVGIEEGSAEVAPEIAPQSLKGPRLFKANLIHHAQVAKPALKRTLPATRHKAWKAKPKSKTSSQPLVGRRSTKDRKARQRTRQTTEHYRSAKRVRESTDRYRFAKRLRQNTESTDRNRFAKRLRQNTERYKAKKAARESTEEYKVKKRCRERGVEAKASRQQRRSARFWGSCLFRWSLLRKGGRYRDVVNAGPHAPRFHKDGRISILQHGVARYLPGTREPPSELQSETDEEDKEEDGGTNLDMQDGVVQERLVWQAEGHGVKLTVPDPSGGLAAGELLTKIWNLYPFVLIRQVQVPVVAAAPAAPVSDRAAALHAEDAAEFSVFQAQREEFELALSLRCRIASINCAKAAYEAKQVCWDPRGCCKKWTRAEAARWTRLQKKLGDRWRDVCEHAEEGSPKDEVELLDIFVDSLDDDMSALVEFHGVVDPKSWPPWFADPTVEPKAPCTGCVQARRLKRYVWHCPMALYSYTQIQNAIDGDYESLPGFSSPPEAVRPYLCNSLCPLVCCTSMCPWSFHASASICKPLDFQECKCVLLRDCPHCRREAMLRDTYSDICLQVPPLLGHVSYTGSIEPVFRSRLTEFSPTVYILTCMRWELFDFQLGPYVPPFDALANAHWRECVRRRGWRPQDFTYDNRASQKSYSAPCSDWSSREGKDWNNNALPEGDYSRRSGYEWRWEKVEEWRRLPASVAACVETLSQVGGKEYRTQLESSMDVRHPDFPRKVRPVVELTTPLSLRCTFCTLLHGRPVPDGICRACTGSVEVHSCHMGRHRAPEDIALRIAQAVACLRSQWHGTDVFVSPSMVLACGDRWGQIVHLLASHRKGCGDQFVIHTLFYDPGPDFPFPFVPDACILSPQARHAAESAFISCLKVISQDFDSRLARALEPLARQKEREDTLRITRVSSAGQLSWTFTQDSLKSAGFKSPMFAIVSPNEQPRVTTGVTEDCECQVPWNQRSAWERLPHAQYELPAATSPWQSRWNASEQSFCWTLSEHASGNALADELVALDRLLDHRALTSYCEALLRVVVRGPMTIVADMSASSNTEVGKERQIQPEAAGVDSPALGSAPANQNTNCLMKCAIETEEGDEDLQSWRSGDSDDTATSENGETGHAETEESERGAESPCSQEGRPSVVQSGSEHEDAEETSFEVDGEDDGVDWSEGIAPATPPQRPWQDKGTPEKEREPVRLGSSLHDYLPGDNSSDDSFECHGYCNESEC